MIKVSEVATGLDYLSWSPRTLGNGTTDMEKLIAKPHRQCEIEVPPQHTYVHIQNTSIKNNAT